MAETISITKKTADLFHNPMISSQDVAAKTEVMSGDVVLGGPGQQKRFVHLKVYRTSLEHFAVVYPLKRLSKPIGIINIKNTRVSSFDESKSQFTINQKMFDVTTSVDLNCESRDFHQWINAFTGRHSPTIIHPTSLPMVEEEDVDY